MPLFSVIMPLYNKAPYVRRAVLSVVEQSLEDWELVVVDDGSSDGSAEVVAAIGDSRIRLVHQQNAGASAARNRGVGESGGRYLCFLDADDWWETAFLGEMAALIERHPNAGIYGTGYYIVKNGRRRVAPIGLGEGFGEGEIDYCAVYARTLCMPLWTGAVCMPREVFDWAGGFPMGISLGEDFLLWVKVALQHRVVLINKPLSNYNQDVDATYRGTHRLHNPERHMLWHLDSLPATTDRSLAVLLDRLKAYSLWPYYLSHKYHAATMPLLEGVDWKNVPGATCRRYRLPLWYARVRECVLMQAVRIKDCLMRARSNHNEFHPISR